MTRENYVQYSDGSYSAATIKCMQLEGDTYKQFMDDVTNGKVRHIGELHCFNEKGEYKVIRNLKSKEFES